VIDAALLLILQVTFSLLRSLPLKAAQFIVLLILRILLALSPRYHKIVSINLKIAFPTASVLEIHRLKNESLVSLARFIVDSARMPLIDVSWVQSNISFPNEESFRALKQAHQEKGILIATGHLGSFELLAHSIALFGYPLSFVVRDFPSPKIDAWWRNMRQRNGNEVISRKGAYRKMIANIDQGKDVAMLFDQNITRERAVFVNFFDRPAATTKALALACIRTGCPLLVASLIYQGSDKYQILWEECAVSDILSDSQKSSGEKVLEITQRVSHIYEKMVRQSPAEWFWLHRRWKTTPLPTDPSPYT
jgi:Kdo2-lipid IVA lauroyltransferase/acyltransferase